MPPSPTNPPLPAKDRGRVLLMARMRTGATSAPTAALFGDERTSSDEHPSERGVDSVGSRDCSEDLGADIRRSHVNDPANRYMSPLAAGIPVDARERE